MSRKLPLVLAILVESQAVLLNYRPLAGTNPWHKPASTSTWVHPDWNIDYFVPDFGMDVDMLRANDSLADAQSEIGHKWVLENSTSIEVGPFNFNVRPATGNQVTAADYTPLLAQRPDFGQDQDVAVSRANLAETEKQFGVKFEADYSDELPYVPSIQPRAPSFYNSDLAQKDYGADPEVTDTTQDIAFAEKQLGHKLYSQFSQTRAQNFQIPDLGADREMLVEQQNWKETEKEYGTFTAVKDDEGVWRTENVQLNNDKNFLMLDLETTSDPICSSAGCEEYLHPKSKEVDWPKDYFVPDFGQDHDIIGAIDNISVAQDQYKHVLTIGSDESKKKFKNPAKDVMYNYAPDLDGDILASQKNLADTEEKLEHVYALP